MSNNYPKKMMKITIKFISNKMIPRINKKIFYQKKLDPILFVQFEHALREYLLESH